LPTSNIDQCSPIQKQSVIDDPLLSKYSGHRKFAEHQGLEEDSTGLPRDSIHQNCHHKKQGDSSLKKSSVHTKFINQVTEEDCQTDECYILRLKDQTKGIRDELMNIQNLLSDLKE